MAKDSVKKRFSGDGPGMSFTEFTYQLIQGYDFYHLYKNYNCVLQMGGSDQWGNITTGTELVRRMSDEEAKAYALTCPLVTKADGTKFGKSEGGNIWLDANKTSVYKFYQYWINTSDIDAEKYIKIFTFLDKSTIDILISEHQQAPHLRLLQKRLAEEITTFVHSKEELDKAIEASNILFGKSTKDQLQKLNNEQIIDVFEGVPTYTIVKEKLATGIGIIDILNGETSILPSKSEARKMIKAGGIQINLEKLDDEQSILNLSDLINEKYIVIRKGKKEYNLIQVE